MSRTEAGQGRTAEEARSLWRGEGPNRRTRVTPRGLERAMHQMARQLELPLENKGEAPTDQRSGEALTAVRDPRRAGTDCLMEAVVEPRNLLPVPRLGPGPLTF